MRRYEYQQRRSPSKVHSRRHGSRPQSHSTPTATKTSVIRANGCVQRTLHPSDRRVCVFQYTPESRPVEPRYLGTILANHHQTENPSQHPWYLNIRRFLHLNRVSVENSIAYMTTHCYRRAPGFHVYEFGRHLYANRDGYLCTIEMWKAYRMNDPMYYSDEHSINDVLPKLKYDSRRNGFNTITTLSITREVCPLIRNAWNNRWWHKYGREDGTRFCEWKSIEEFEGNGTENESTGPGHQLGKIVRSFPYFGVFVDNKAKLILRDTITARSVMDYNHTLIQSGVFIVVQGKCGVTFMDNTQKVYQLSDVYRRRVSYPRIIVVNAVPSIGESVCWGLTVGEELSVHSVRSTGIAWGDDETIDDEVIGLEAILNVPLLGMNSERMQIYRWDKGYQYVARTQRSFNYGQFVRSDANFALSEHDVRSAQFVPNEPLEYPRY